ncbi:hypothetical protein NN561_015264 [Cricetulus griseus]
MRARLSLLAVRGRSEGFAGRIIVESSSLFGWRLHGTKCRTVSSQRARFDLCRHKSFCLLDSTEAGRGRRGPERRELGGDTVKVAKHNLPRLLAGGERQEAASRCSLYEWELPATPPPARLAAGLLPPSARLFGCSAVRLRHRAG